MGVDLARAAVPHIRPRVPFGQRLALPDGLVPLLRRIGWMLVPSAASPASGSCSGRSASPMPSCCRRRTSSSATSPSRPVLQHRQRWQIGTGMNAGPSPAMAVLITVLASTGRVLAGLPWPPPCRSWSGWRSLRRAVRAPDPADHHAPGAGLADRVAAGGDLHVRDRQRPGDLHGVHRPVLHDGALDHPADRRGQPELHQRRPDDGGDEAPDLRAGDRAGDPAGACWRCCASTCSAPGWWCSSPRRPASATGSAR